MKSMTVFIKDLNPKFGIVNYETDICTISIEQNTFYSMAASEVTTRKSSLESSHSELIRKKNALKI